MSEQLREIARQIFDEVLAVKEPVRLWEWIEQNCELPAESGSKLKGPIDTSLTPCFRAIYDAFEDPETRFLDVVKSAQVGGTVFLKNLVCYNAVEHPGPSFYITSTAMQAKRFNDRELEPHIRMCKPAEMLAHRKKGDWSKSEKIWLNGATLGLAGSNSVSQLASRVVERLLMDEVDKWPGESEKEASADDLAEARTKTYEDRRKIVAISTPTLDSGLIWSRYLRGTQELFEVPCPHCGHYQVLQFFRDASGGIGWPEEARREDGSWDLDKVYAETYYECGACKYHIREQEKRKMLLQCRVKQTNPNASRRRRSFSINAMYSLFETWGGMAIAYLQAESQAGKLHDFYNAYLGLPWVRHATSVKRGHIHDVQEGSPRYKRGELPVLPKVLTMTVDVQQENFWWLIRAWDHKRGSYLLDYGSAVSYEDLEELSRREYKFGPRVCRVYKVMIDSGYTAKRRAGVYDYCLRSGGRFFPCKGGSKESGLLHPIRETSIMHRQTKLILVTFDSDIYSEELYCRRIQERAGPDWYLPTALESEYYKQLTSERLTEKKKPSGKGVDLKWECPTRDNHLGDCEKMQLVFGDMLASYLEQKEPEPEEKMPEEKLPEGRIPEFNPYVDTEEPVWKLE